MFLNFSCNIICLQLKQQSLNKNSSFMKKQKLSKEQKAEIDKYGSNTWFVESLYEQFIENPNSVPVQWKELFSNSQIISESIKNDQEKIDYSRIEGDEFKLISGSATRILENMQASLSIPTATSLRAIPMKVLEENRLIINDYVKRNLQIKISFTHIIAFAIVTALKRYPVMNSAYAEKDSKSFIVRRKNINLGIAIDILKKDGSRSLLVPNIKSANEKSFIDFVLAYDDIVNRSRTGQINPDEFIGTTISLTNPGTIGTNASMPRLMIGQGVIIAIGAVQYPVEFRAMSKELIANLGISKVINISSTYDHRIIQGAESGLFLKEIDELLTGNNNFYEKIFNDLKIPLQPVKCMNDQNNSYLTTSNLSDEFEKQARVIQLINTYRVRGHLVADINPLGSVSTYHKELDIEFHKLSIWDLDRNFITGGFSGLKTSSLRNILEILKRTYCDKIGVEYMHIQNPDEKKWLQDNMEPVGNRTYFNNETRLEILNKLIKAEGFEHFIHTNFLGHKRFSLEGSETLIPLLNYLFTIAIKNSVKEIILGMAHRGRLNLLANLMGKSYDEIFSEFEDLYDPDSAQGSGDVKYHLGVSGEFKLKSGEVIGLTLASNPSHLEFVNPVVEGIVRAKQTRKNDVNRKQIIPVLIHGDSAFAGQGIVTETLNLSQLEGYKTGGTIHIIINNQIGFTTTPDEARSTIYATDVAKMVQAPIFHINGDDPEAAIWVTQLAFDYRQRFHKDIVIDLIGYRRHGHNEGDEPGFTQPLMYEKIKNHPSVLEIYSKKLFDENLITDKEFEQIKNSFENRLNLVLNKVKKKKYEFKSSIPLSVPVRKLSSGKSSSKRVDEKIINEIASSLADLPFSFNIHSKLKKLLEKRRQFAENKTNADWALAEHIAFGTLLREGIPVRLSGQDSVRGTFSQRHLAFTDTLTGKEYIPLNNISSNQAKIEAVDSLLSEAAVLGFEFGYSISDPLTLVIWEAQFGDFANGAQVIIDNFLVASKEKWKIPSNLVLLLPHGYEGQGPEHSSARIERFLVLSAQENIEIAYPSTPAQYFNLLRRQIYKGFQRPLIVMTPKSMLRLHEAVSSKKDFLDGKFKEFIDDEEIGKPGEIKKIILTSGKVFYELKSYKKKNLITDTAIIRIEQFYPFDEMNLKQIIEKYNKVEKIVWTQEEPENMGAWGFLNNKLKKLIQPSQKLFYSGRPESASPAPGSARATLLQQQDLIQNAFLL